ncbi:mariner Mos1 transposase [Trichonephila clavipes]|nr:mariner Mos1 transposase [Trichonephila clavipes]
MSNFMPSDHDLRTALIFCYHLKKIAAESHQMLVEANGGNVLSRAQCYRLYIDPGQPSKSTARPNRFGRKTMLCIFWDQEGPIYYELLKPGETVNTDHYKQQLLNLNDAILEKHEQYKKRQHKVIFLDDNAPSHRAKPTKDIVKALGWEPLAHAAYLPDLAPSDYHLFVSLGQHFLTSASLLTKTSNIGLMTGWPQKTNHFFGVVFTNCPKDGENV